MALSQNNLILLQNTAATGVEFTERAVNWAKGSLLAGGSSAVPIEIPGGTGFTPIELGANYYLVNDGSGTLGWAAIAGGHTQHTDTGTTSDHFIINSGSSSGRVSVAGTATNVLEARTYDNSAYVDFKAKSITATVDLTVEGDLLVKGNTTTFNTATLEVEDKNIELAKVTSPSDAIASTGGITLKGTTDKTIIWNNSAPYAWTSNQNFDLAVTKGYYANTHAVLIDHDVNSGEHMLGALVTKASGLNYVGTISTGTWTASAIGAPYGGTGFTSYAIGDLIAANGTDSLAKISLPSGTNNRVLKGIGGSATTPAWAQVNLGDAVTASGGSEMCYGVVPYTNGGTGISALGTANQVLGVTAAGTGTEYKTITCSDNAVTITHTANTITFTANSSSDYYKSKWKTGSSSTGYISDIILAATNGGIIIPPGGTNASNSSVYLDISDLTAATDLVAADLVGVHVTGTGTRKITMENFHKEFNLLVTAPATATSTGKVGQVAYDGNYAYYCYEADKWSRWLAAKTWA